MSSGALWILMVINVRPFKATEGESCSRVQVAHSYARDNRGDTELMLLLWERKKKKRETVMRYQTVCFAANLLLWRNRTVPSIWWDSQEYTQAVTLTIHSLKAKSNVSICVKRKTFSFDIWAAIPMEQLVYSHQGHEKERLSKHDVL